MNQHPNDQLTENHSSRSTAHFMQVILFALAICLTGSHAWSEDSPAPAVSTAESSTSEVTPAEQPEAVADSDQLIHKRTQETLQTADRETERHRQTMAALMALVGIVIGAIIFLVVIMVWGARLRRMIRKDLPAQKTIYQDLWFLKPPKNLSDKNRKEKP